MEIKPLMFLLLISGACGESNDKGAMFIYSSVGGATLLPCRDLLVHNCSLISWTFYKGGHVRYGVEVRGGRVVTDSDKSARMSTTSDCSLSIVGLRFDDAGSYVCLKNGSAVTNVYLSLLAVMSSSSVTELRPGGRVALSCVLFTFFDAGSCKQQSNSGFTLSWDVQAGARYELTNESRCNITMVTQLQQEDHNRKWRCQVTLADSSRVFQDFRSTLLFQDQDPSFSTTEATCLSEEPITRIALCIALPVMVVVVGVFYWRQDRKWKTNAAAIEIQEVS